MILYSLTRLVSFSPRRMAFPSATTRSTSHLGSVKNRFMLLWSFLSTKSSLMLFTSCSFSPATISPSMTLQKFSYWGLVKYLLNPESRCLTLLGTPDRKPNMTPQAHHKAGWALEYHDPVAASITYVLVQRPEGNTALVARERLTSCYLLLHDLIEREHAA